MSLLGLGLIGCGEIAAHTAAKLKQCTRATIVHCADPIPVLAEDIARQHNARWTTRNEELLADTHVDAVIISTPHCLHAPLAIKAAEAGKHVIVEKPMACTLDDADAMIAASASARVRLGVLFPFRYTFVNARARLRARDCWAALSPSSSAPLASSPIRTGKEASPAAARATGAPRVPGAAAASSS